MFDVILARMTYGYLVIFAVPWTTRSRDESSLEDESWSAHDVGCGAWVRRVGRGSDQTGLKRLQAQETGRLFQTGSIGLAQGLNRGQCIKA